MNGSNSRLDKVMSNANQQNAKIIFSWSLWFLAFIFGETSWNSMTFYVSHYFVYYLYRFYMPVCQFIRVWSLNLPTCLVSSGLIFYWTTSLWVKFWKNWESETKTVIGKSPITSIPKHLNSPEIFVCLKRQELLPFQTTWISQFFCEVYAVNMFSFLVSCVVIFCFVCVCSIHVFSMSIDMSLSLTLLYVHII